MKAPQIEKWDDDAKNSVNAWLKEVEKLLSGGLLLTSNLDLRIKEVTFGATGVETPIEHGLGRVPQGFLVVDRTADLQIYKTDRQSGADKIYLASSTDNPKVKLLFF
jgi:hypothetical protein